MATALYRRYRPESFAEVIGQDHVTTPLRRALRAGRVGHAYLFSGPRGCGKTTSARILARCLNCAQGPTDVPCGQCDSCRDLANGGAGSLDVVEIDAASHGGVDDARELRERASFAPVRDRYKVFIIDEAHMVTSAGFNALLKLVEEPPEHVKFVFATTEPDKVIGTIRSRTHHYPFRLIPPQVLGPYLEEVCAAEQVQVGEGVMPLVVRAGGGSARDSMSVLDQLMAGASEDGLDFPTAIALLGFTDTALLDTAVTAVAERDAAALYSAVEHVLATGHEPRRFVEDLLERMRDLIVLAAVPERGADLLPQVPADELESMRGQAALFAPADLSQCGDLVHETLSTMSGATSPRLHLELLAARLVLRDERAALAAAEGPAPTTDQRGGTAAAHAGQPAPAAAQGGAPGASGAREEARRIAQEKVEAARQARGGRSGGPAAPAGAPAPDQRGAAPQAPAPAAAQTAPAESSAGRPDPSAPPERVPWGDAAQQSAPQRPAAQGSDAHDSRATGAPQQAAAQHAPNQQAPAQQAPAQDAGAQQAAPQQAPPRDAAAQQPPAPAQPAAGGGIEADQVRGHWSAILDELQQIRRPSWALISQNGHVNGVHGSTLVIGFRTEGLVNAFHRGTAAQNLADAVRRIMHVEVTVEAVVGDDPGPGGAPGPGPGGAPGPGPGGAPGAGGPGRGPGGGDAGASGSAGPAGPAGGSGPARGGPASGGPAPARGSGTPAGSAAPDAAGGAAPEAPAPAPTMGAQESPARWGDAVSTMAPREPAPGAPSAAPAPAPSPSEEEAPALSAGQRASERALRAAERAAQAGRPGPSPERVEDFPPEPDDPFPPDPRDEYQPRPPQPAGPASGTEAPPSGGGRWSEALSGRDETSEKSAGPAAAAPGPAPSGEIPVVEDAGRDSLPPEQPRTYGQNALRRALAERRVVHSRPAQHLTATTPEGTGGTWEKQAGTSAGEAPEQEEQPTVDGRPALQAVPPMASGATDDAPSTEDAPPAPAGADSASARAAASWGTAATVPAPAGSAPSAPAPSAPAPSEPGPSAAPAAPRSGAALVREAAQASRGAGQRPGGLRGPGSADPAADADPTGGATRDDEDAVVTTRNGREVVEKLLGGKVLEIIDENRSY